MGTVAQKLSGLRSVAQVASRHFDAVPASRNGIEAAEELVEPGTVIGERLHRRIGGGVASGPGQDLVLAVRVDVTGSDRAAVVGQERRDVEARNRGDPDAVEVVPDKARRKRRARTLRCGDLGVSVTIEVSSGHPRAVFGRREGVVVDLPDRAQRAGVVVETSDLRREDDPRSRPGEDLGIPVGFDVARGGVDAEPEGLVGVEADPADHLNLHAVVVETLDVGTEDVAASRPRQDLGEGVVVEIPGAGMATCASTPSSNVSRPTNRCAYQTDRDVPVAIDGKAIEQLFQKLLLGRLRKADRLSDGFVERLES